MFYIEVLTCLSDDFPVAQTMEQIAYQIPPSLDLHVIMEHSPSVINYYHLIAMRNFIYRMQREEYLECTMTM